MSEPVKVMFAVRSMGEMLTPTAQCMSECYAYMAMKYVPGGHLALSMFSVSGSILPDITESIAAHAIEREVDYIFWIDADMTFPPDTLEKLLVSAQMAEAPVVGVCYPQRRRPAKPTAMLLDKTWAYLDDLEPDEHGLVDVEFMGMGCLLTHVDVFRELPRPWFPFAYDHKQNRWGGEDVYMMRAVREHMGYTPKMHVEASRKIGHIGTHTFTYQDSIADRDRENETCRDGVMPHQDAAE